MNPMNWSREHQIALLLAVLIGITVGVIIGYAVYAAGSGADGARSMSVWLTQYPTRHGVHWWALTGGLVGVGVTFFRRLTR